MYKRYLAIVFQVSLIVLGLQRTLHAQHSPSDLVVGELSATHAPWLPVCESEQNDSVIDESLQPDYSDNACDAMPRPPKSAITQASWLGSTPSRSLQPPRSPGNPRVVARSRNKAAPHEKSDSLRKLRDAIQAAGQRLRFALLSSPPLENERVSPS
jgi:hypothetical protein